MKWWVSLMMLCLSSSAFAASCTDGTDCYCDLVQGGDLNDTSVLMCEDFEAVTLRDTGTSREGDGSPDYGPWHDDGDGNTAAGGCNRGANSYWYQMYGNGVNAVLVDDGQPVSPTLGCSCDVGGSRCVGAKIWEASNAFGTNADAAIAMLTAGEFDEVDGNTDPTNAQGGASGQFDGTTSMHTRNDAGHTSGISGSWSFSSDYTEIGATVAVAFANNLGTSGLLGAPWKFDEWGDALDGPFMFHVASSIGDDFPFDNFFFYISDDDTTCATKVAASTVTLGRLICDGNAYRFRADESKYLRSVDLSGSGGSAGWPLGAWACVRGHYTGLGTTNTSIEMWFQGPGDSAEVKIIDISGLNTTGAGPAQGGAGYGSFTWNNHANTNQGGEGDVASTDASGRYLDNYHIRNGEPVSCEQIGFDGGAEPASNPIAIFLANWAALALILPLAWLFYSIRPQPGTANIRGVGHAIPGK